MLSEQIICGSIVDSWIERPGTWHRDSMVVLQVAPRDCPQDLWIVEVSPSLLPDNTWLADLRENLCHGSPVAAVGRIGNGGHMTATRLHLER
jgi:hypothetical protein